MVGEGFDAQYLLERDIYYFIEISNQKLSYKIDAPINCDSLLFLIYKIHK